MSAENPRPKTINEYIAGYPEDVRNILEKIRQIIRTAAPEAVETMNYGIPTFVYGGNLVHFAAYKNHIGFYPAPSGIEKFKEEISPYEWAKGSVQFPLEKPIPFDLIQRIVEFRIKENLEIAAAKGKKAK